jgi:hypothetical protein
MTEVIIYDYYVKQRMIYTLTAADFAEYTARCDQTDKLLVAMQDHPFFEGCRHWGDLELRHLHVMIVNVLQIVGESSDEQQVNPANQAVQSLTFLLCALLGRLRRKDVHIDLLRVTRMTVDNVVYDYCATLDIEIAPTPVSSLRLIVV